MSLEDGVPLWTFEARHPIFSSPVAFDGRVYVGEGLHYTRDAKLYCLDVVTGNVIWDFQTTSHTESTPAVSNRKVYFGAGDDGLYCLDAETGRLKWRFSDAHVDGGPLLHNGRVYIDYRIHRFEVRRLFRLSGGCFHCESKPKACS